MTRRKLVLGGVVVLCLVTLVVVLGAAPVWADLMSMIHTTLEDFNTGDLYHTGLTRVDDGEVQLLVVGLSGEWITDTNTTGLPALYGHTAAFHNGHLIVVGGKSTDQQARRQAYYTTILADHNLANWQSTSALPLAAYPNGVYWHGTAVVDDYIYVIGGGHDQSSYFDTVAYAEIGTDGSLSTWQTTTPLPVALRNPQAVAADGRIYVLGGRTDGGTPSDLVYYATVQPDGTTSSWTATTAMPYRSWGHMVAVFEGKIYMMGGFNEHLPSPNIAPYVHFATVNPDGTLGAWTATTEMENNLYGAAGISFAGVLFTTGGAMNGLDAASDYVGTSLIDEATGQVGTWQDTSLIFPARLWHATVRTDDEWLYVIHGNDGNGAIASINRGTTSGIGEQYAPDGTYANQFNLDSAYELEELSWNTTIPDPSVMTITMRWREKDVAGEDWGPWHGPFPSTPGTSVTTTEDMVGNGRFVQYEAYFASSDPEQTPVLNAVQIKYEVPAYRLKVIKSADPVHGSLVSPGQIISYTLTYSNAVGGITATEAFIQDFVPEYTSYVPGSIQGPGADDSTPGRMYWDLGSAVGDIAPGDSGQVSYAVIISDGLPGGLNIENQAIIDSSDGPIRESNLVSHTLIIEGPDFVIDSITWSPSEPEPGQLLDFAVTVRNQGTLAAQDSFYVELYIKDYPSDPPDGPTDHDQGYCLDDCATLRGDYVRLLPALANGETYVAHFSGADVYLSEAGLYDVYAQADLWFDAPEFNRLWGLIPEENELNNIAHEKVLISGAPTIYLPVVYRLYPAP